MFHYRGFGCGVGLFCASLPSYPRCFGCILVAEWVHQHLAWLQSGCKQGARTSPASYSGCILGAKRAHAHVISKHQLWQCSECPCPTPLLMKAKMPNLRQPTGRNRAAQNAGERNSAAASPAGDLKSALSALVEERPQSKFGQLRRIRPDIKAALQDGHQLKYAVSRDQQKREYEFHRNTTSNPEY